jgi:DNA-binding HxlR family transcriptional regulator
VSATGGDERTWTHRQWTPLARALTATGDRWTLLIVLALGSETIRLTRLRERLPGISAAVLDHHVHRLATLGLLTRRRWREMPPRVDIKLNESGRELLPIAAALARWGMRRMWFSPVASAERVDVGALLRLLPLLLEEATGLPEGIAETTLRSGDAPVRHVFKIEHGRLHAVDEVGRTPAAGIARIEGDDAAWIAALGPGRDYTRLRFAGKKQLAMRILNALPGGP